MTAKQSLAALASAIVATAMMSVRAADSPPPASTNTPDADVLLRQMSDKLGAAQKFSFKVRREIDAGLATEDGLPGNARMMVTVQRPDKLLVHTAGPGIVRQFYADGTNLCLVDTKNNLYATVPMAAALDELPLKLATIYGFTPPLAVFVISHPYQDIVWRAQNIAYAGMGTIHSGFLGLKSIPCHRLALSGKQADAELWIGVSDLLPRRLTATVKRDTGNVNITLEFSGWNLAANTRNEDFVFTPGKDEMQIPMATVSEMKAASQAGK